METDERPSLLKIFLLQAAAVKKELPQTNAQNALNSLRKGLGK
jgi:hypothetical protein